MQELKIYLDDTTFAKITAIAKQAGIQDSDIATWGARQIEQRIIQILPTSPEKQMTQEEWEALLRGENCSICKNFASNEAFDGYAYPIADLRVTRFRLTQNQYIYGECILSYKRHVSEIYELSIEEQHFLIEDIAQATRALQAVFQPLKISLDTGSSALPHLYLRLKPRYATDIAQNTLPAHMATRLLSPEEYAERVKSLRAAL